MWRTLFCSTCAVPPPPPPPSPTPWCNLKVVAICECTPSGKSVHTPAHCAQLIQWTGRVNHTKRLSDSGGSCSRWVAIADTAPTCVSSAGLDSGTSVSFLPCVANRLHFLFRHALQCQFDACPQIRWQVAFPGMPAMSEYANRCLLAFSR